MNIPGLITTKRAAAAIAARRILIHAATANQVQQAAGGSALLVGVSTDIASDSGEPVDVIRSGLAPVLYGGTVTQGAPLTADSQGRAVAVTLPVAEDTYILGFAEVAGVSGDIGSIFIAPSLLAAAE